MSAALTMRFVFAVIGAYVLFYISRFALQRVPFSVESYLGYYYAASAFVGLLLGFFAGLPFVRLVRRFLIRKIEGIPSERILMASAGLVLGLLMASLLAAPLAALPGGWGQILPLLAAVVLAILGATTMIVRDRELLGVLGLQVVGDGIRWKRDLILLDTSAIIDGRIVDIRGAGFLRGTLLVPRFVLEELQHIADSPDSLRRNRGRRGLEILNEMRSDPDIALEISYVSVSGTAEVDGKLVRLAQRLDCPIITNDYNLNRVAELQNVQVLNVNELANAVKAVVLPGESVHVRIIQEGKEAGQGVGYLDDGTMVVIEDGRRHINTSVDAVVTRVLQTVAGRMIFAYLREDVEGK